MQSRALWIGLFSAATLLAAEKKLPLEQTSNELVEISATVLVDKDQIRQEVGSDLGGNIILVRIQVRPVSEKPVQISHDDFLLISSKDGQRSQPFEPSQIAGNSSLVVTQSGARAGHTRGEAGLGGILGIGGGAVGNSSSPSSLDTKVETAESDKKDNPVLSALKQKILPEKEISGPASGLLYFEIEGKVKPKDLELRYKTPGGQLAVRFREK